MGNTGKSKLPSDAVESNTTTWKIPRVIVPGGAKIIKGQMTDFKDEKKQYSALHGGSGSDGGSESSKSNGGGKGNESDDIKKTRGSSKVAKGCDGRIDKRANTT